MSTVHPFRALRPVPDKVSEVASVPYDVVTTKEARRQAEKNPLSFLHVIRPEIDLPDGTDLYSDAVYARAKENLEKLIAKGVLIEEDKPSLYIYRLSTPNHSQTGVVACCSVDEYNQGLIKKHELTRKEKEDDRLRHMLTVSAHTGPVLLTYRNNKKLKALTKEQSSYTPLFDFIAEDGVQHTIWRITNNEPFVNAFKEVPALYIADGHHRAAGASRVQKEMLKRFPNSPAIEEYNYFLAVMFPASELKIYPYNRYISNLGDNDPLKFIKKIKQGLTVHEKVVQQPARKGIIGMYLQNKWYELIIPSEAYNKNDPVASLDLSVFQRLILEPILGIYDQKKDPRIDFVGGPDSIQKLTVRVDREGGVAFTFYPVTIDELLMVADANKIMPPKSTWFAPKLRSGLLIHRF